VLLWAVPVTPKYFPTESSATPKKEKDGDGKKEKDTDGEKEKKGLAFPSCPHEGGKHPKSPAEKHKEKHKERWGLLPAVRGHQPRGHGIGGAEKRPPSACSFHGCRQHRQRTKGQLPAAAAAPGQLLERGGTKDIFPFHLFNAIYSLGEGCSGDALLSSLPRKLSKSGSHAATPQDHRVDSIPERYLPKGSLTLTQGNAGRCWVLLGAAGCCQPQGGSLGAGGTRG